MAAHPPEGPQSVSVDEHRQRILPAIAPLTPVAVPLHEALGRTLAAAVSAIVDYPGFDNSAMDGYAVHRSDVVDARPDHPAALEVVTDLPAGTTDNPQLPAGQAARIMTGAPVPDDADAVVPVEDTDGGERTVLVLRAPQPAAHIRRTASDLAAGDAVLPVGRVLTARDLAVAAVAGATELLVHPAPRVGVIATGNELRPAGSPLTRGELHDSNSLLLAAVVTASGGIPVQLGSVVDDEDALRTVFETHAPHVDAFVTSGGVSVGAYDVVRTLLAPLGVWFGSVRMQPGKPQGFGRWPGGGASGVPIFALPGNPVSTFVSAQEFLVPALLALQGRPDAASHVEKRLVRARAAEGWTSTPHRRQFLPVILDPADSDPTELTVRPAGGPGNGSHRLSAFAAANAIAVVDEEVTAVSVGDACDCYYIL